LHGGEAAKPQQRESGEQTHRKTVRDFWGDGFLHGGIWPGFLQGPLITKAVREEREDPHEIGGHCNVGLKRTERR
jgi:hypothetical protein